MQEIIWEKPPSICPWPTAYGDGEDKSCRLVAEAVSQLLEDIPIQKYISSDLSSISQINDLVGGVTVTVPGDDLEYLGARFKKGRTLKLEGEMAEQFVRSRNTEEDFSNAGRMERQKVYLTAYLENCRSGPTRIWKACCQT